MPTVDMYFVYDDLSWATVNAHLDLHKRECLMDPQRVSIEVQQLQVGETSFTYTGSTPMWARMFLPPMCRWRDTVLIDETKSVRTERGENLTTTSGEVFIDERSRWYMDPERPTDTVFERRLEIRVRGFPDVFLRTCLNVYRETTIKVLHSYGPT